MNTDWHPKRRLKAVNLVHRLVTIALNLISRMTLKNLRFIVPNSDISRKSHIDLKVLTHVN